MHGSREIDRRVNICFHRILLSVGDDAHNGHPSRAGVLWAVKCHLMTDRILAVEIASRKGLIDQHRLRPSLAILFGERTSKQERDAHRLDVPIANSQYICIAAGAGRSRLTAGDAETQEASRATEWQRSDSRSRDNSRNPANALEELLVKRGNLLIRAIFHLGQRYSHRQQILPIEPGVEVQQSV